MSLRAVEIVIDCREHESLERFWTQALGWRSRRVNDQYVAIIPPDRSTVGILLQQVPEPKIAKNRVHIDWEADDMAAEVARLEGLGAKRVIERTLGSATRWTVMEDPEGNEFCVTQGGQAT